VFRQTGLKQLIFSGFVGPKNGNLVSECSDCQSPIFSLETTRKMSDSKPVIVPILLK